MERNRTVTENTETENVRLKDVWRFPVTFWLLCICTMAYYGSIFPFVSLAQGFFKKEFNFSEPEANFITGYFLNLILTLYTPFKPRIGVSCVSLSFSSLRADDRQNRKKCQLGLGLSNRKPCCPWVDQLHLPDPLPVHHHDGDVLQYLVFSSLVSPSTPHN